MRESENKWTTIRWETFALLIAAVFGAGFLSGIFFAKRSIEFHAPNEFYDHCYHGHEER